jgi:arabinosyltransferase
VPDALRLSPRLAQHLELIRRHYLALRDAFALAYILKRKVILPRLPCMCDRSEAPSVLRDCTYEGSGLQLPYDCPLTHIFDVFQATAL